jgi:hypothetical protein
MGFNSGFKGLMKIFLIFAYTESTLAIQQNLLAVLDLIFCFLKIGIGVISSGNIKSVDTFSVGFEVEGVEYEVVLKAELLATSELKAQFEAVCVTDSFRDSSAPAHGLCSSVAASKSKS